MSNPSPKLVMMRFDPRGGWVKPSEEAVHVEPSVQAEQPEPAATLPQPEAPAKFSAQSITELGDSIVDVFN